MDWRLQKRRQINVKRLPLYFPTLYRSVDEELNIDLTLRALSLGAVLKFIQDEEEVKREGRGEGKIDVCIASLIEGVSLALKKFDFSLFDIF